MDKKIRQVETCRIFWRWQSDLTTFCGYALNVDGSATQFLRNSVPALPLLAKNSFPNCFLNARTQGFKSDFITQTKNKNQTDWSGFYFCVYNSFLSKVKTAQQVGIGITDSNVYFVIFVSSSSIV